ncbi:MAG TPA: insulinase family protein [Pyrinomonadaceae bacterium]|nr:insulinase family protein [Pyrinomonadaceae bacterium]
MNTIALMSFLRRVVLTACCLGLIHASVEPISAQVPMEPGHARLLNGLRVMVWSRPGDQDVLIKLRVHSGAAFDLAGKTGSMALLGDILFPDPSSREYFKDMQGQLNVNTDYDSLTITMQGRAQEFERIVEILRTAIVTTQLTPENFAKVREGRIKVLKDTAISPTMLADRAIATRLFGDFPYGRPSGGTVESLERIEKADLMLARERFLNPNNATLTVIGGVENNRAMRVLRQLIGVWRKSEEVVPATFKQPSAPDARTLLINAPADQSAEIRLAVRGVSREDADAPAAAVLAILARQRWTKLLPELGRSPMYVRHNAFALPGIFVMGASVDSVLAGKALASAKETLQSLASSPVTGAELEQARNELIIQSTNSLAKPDGIADAWLDGDTYALASVAERMRVLSGVTAGDLQRVATRLFRDGAFASVVLGDSAVVKAQIERYGKVEVLGEIAPAKDLKPGSQPKPDSASKPPIRSPAKP